MVSKFIRNVLFSFACSKILTCTSELLYTSHRSLQLSISDLTRNISFANKNIMQDFESTFVGGGLYDKAIICGICAGQLGNGTHFY